MTKVKTGLSKKLLTRVLSVYFVLTLVVTAGQIFTEYLNAKHHIVSELQVLKNTFSTSLTRAIWELNAPQARSIAEGLIQLPIVEGVQVRDENGNYIADLGKTTVLNITHVNEGTMHEHTGTTFGYTFPLIFEFSGRTSNVGDVTLYSSFEIIFERIQVGVYFLVGNAILKTAFLVFLFLNAFRALLTDPLSEMTRQMNEFDIEHLEQSKLAVNIRDENELKVLTNAYNNLVDDLINFQRRLDKTQSDLRAANRKLDEQNLQLEQEVAKKTATLSRIMLDIEQQRDSLIDKQSALQIENASRRQMEETLLQKNQELANSMEVLQLTKDQLIESERMASLGGLVAGIAHDVNTPIGVSVTAASFLEERLKKLHQDFDDKQLTNKSMALFLEDAEKTTGLLVNNLTRASDLIASFKQVSVDQTSEAVREIEMKSYIREIIVSLAPKLKKTQHTINVECRDNMQIKCAPGAIAQILTNMILNSLIHGFEDNANGIIDINVTDDDQEICIAYKDNGVGFA